MVRVIDPPSGWKYGFPKVFDCPEDGDMYQWLVDNGYPRAEIDKLGEHFYCRFWTQEE